MLIFNGYRSSNPGIKRCGPDLASRLKMSGAVPVFPLYALMVCTGTPLTVTFLQYSYTHHKNGDRLGFSYC
jgi:hypothetical protein